MPGLILHHYDPSPTEMVNPWADAPALLALKAEPPHYAGGVPDITAITAFADTKPFI